MERYVFPLDELSDAEKSVITAQLYPEVEPKRLLDPAPKKYQATPPAKLGRWERIVGKYELLPDGHQVLIKLDVAGLGPDKRLLGIRGTLQCSFLRIPAGERLLFSLDLNVDEE